MRDAALIVLGILLVCPLAAAAPVWADLTFEEPARLDGAARVVFEEGAIDLSEALRAGGAIEMPVEILEGFQKLQRRLRVLELESIEPDTENITVPRGPATLRIETCAGACEVLLYSEGEGRLEMGGRIASGFAWTTEARSYHKLAAKPGVPGAFYYPVPPGTLSFASGERREDAAALVADDVRASGRLHLFLANVTVQVVTSEGTRPFEVVDRDEGGAAQVGVNRLKTYMWLDLRLDGSGLSPERPVLLFGRDPTVTIDGRVQSASATGIVREGAKTRSIDDEPLTAVGTFDLRPALVLAAHAPLGGASLLSEPDVRASLEGDATYLSVAHEPLVRESATLPVATSIGALLVLALALKLLLVPLYSRVSAARVLGHERRRRIHALLAERPGITAVEIARSLDVPRAAVLHHLSMLEGHRFVVARRVGWARQYFLPEGAPSAEALVVHKVLADPTRRDIALRVRSMPFATQPSLIAQTGLSQRLVSYHLERLCEAGLVSAREGRPRVYTATPALASALPAPEA